MTEKKYFTIREIEKKLDIINKDEIVQIHTPYCYLEDAISILLEVDENGNFTMDRSDIIDLILKEKT